MQTAALTAPETQHLQVTPSSCTEASLVQKSGSPRASFSRTSQVENVTATSHSATVPEPQLTPPKAELVRPQGGDTC